MRIAIASGKGGTGKTTVAVNLAVALAGSAEAAELGPVTYVDCDVDEPNGHLYLAPELEKLRPVTVMVPRTVKGRCTGCGECQQACQFRAILTVERSVMVFDELCHGCGTCLIACPEDALEEVPRRIGTLRPGRAGPVGFLDGVLDVGEARSTPMIAAVREAEPKQGLVLADAPPGATCPTMEAIQDSDLLLLVADPTPFGLHDLGVMVELARALGLPVAVVLNRADLGDRAVVRFCESKGVPVLDELTYDSELAAFGAEGQVAARESEDLHERFAEIGRAVLQRAAAGGGGAP